MITSRKIDFFLSLLCTGWWPHVSIGSCRFIWKRGVADVCDSCICNPQHNESYKDVVLSSTIDDYYLYYK